MLNDYEEKIVVLEWFNEKCPVCEGVWNSGLIRKLVTDLGELDTEVVGKAYGAKTTPHMYVIDQEGILVYQGAISDDRRGKEGKEAETHVMRAVKQVITGGDVKPNYVQPWGCSVKYKRDSDGKDRERRRPRGPRQGPGR